MSNKISFSYSMNGPDAKETVEDGIEAEKLGFDQIFIGDHLTDLPPPEDHYGGVLDAWSILSAIGSKTQKIKLCPGVTDVQRSHPARIANTVSTLDHLTDGRIACGIGAGEAINLKPFGIVWEEPGVRVRRFREAITVMKLLWSSTYKEPVSFSGEFHKLEEAYLGLRPLQKPHPPIYTGAIRNKMLEITGEVGDGWFPGTLNTPESFRAKINIIKNSAEKAGRNLSEIEIIAIVPTVINSDPEIRKEIEKNYKRAFIYQRSLLEYLGVGDLIKTIPKELEYQLVTPTLESSMAIDKAAEELPIPNEVLSRAVDETMAVGTRDECITSLERFIKAGATKLELFPPVSTKENYAKAAKEIIPYFK